MDEYNKKQFDERYKIVCNKCGSENVLIDFYSGTTYSEFSVDPDTMSFRCPDCDDEEIVLYP